MRTLNRRDTLRQAAALGTATVVTAGRTQAAQDATAKASQDAPAKQDRDFVIAAGMTEAEAHCWELAASTAGAFFDLPEMHPMDKQEIATAIHVIQNKLLSRPTYRKYLEQAKAASRKT